MLTHEQKTAILNLLTESRRALSDQLPRIRSEQDLERFVFMLELREEIAALSAMVDTDHFEEAFRERCRVRAIINTNTPLSLFSLPYGVCNNLYWNILLQLIPAPSSMGEMLAVLAPNAGRILRPEPGFQRNEGRVEYNITLIEEPVVTALTQPASQEELSKLTVLREGLLFNVDDISAYNFELHSTFYEQLSHQYADTIDNLYQHNQALKTLQNQMLQISQGQAPLDAIQRLISGLEEVHPFANFAENFAGNIAFTDFLVYLESLAPEDKRRLQALTTSRYSKTIEAVIRDLRHGGCTMAANSTLRAIINNSENHAVLTSRNRSFPLSPEDIISIKSRYKRSNPLSTAHDDTKKNPMPESLIENCISDITISTQHYCAILLQYFPPSLYGALLRDSRITPDFSQSPLLLFRRGGIILNEQQQRALEIAILANHSKFGDLGQISVFAIEQNYHYLAEHILSLTNAQGNTALHLMASNYTPTWTWAASIAKLPENGRLAAVQKKNNEGKSVLDLIIYWPNLVNVIVTSLPEDVLLATLTERRGRYSSLVSYMDLNTLPTTLSVGARRTIHEANQLDKYWFAIHLSTDLSACFGTAALVFGIILLDTALAPILAGLGAGLLIGATALACYSFFSSKSPGNPVIAASNNRAADQPPAVEMTVAL